MPSLKKRIEELYFRLNEEKLLKWLICKVNNLTELFNKNNSIIAGRNGVSKTLEEKQVDTPKLPLIELQEDAVRMICEYLNQEIMEKLFVHFKINPIKANYMNQFMCKVTTRSFASSPAKDKKIEKKKTLKKEKEEEEDKTTKITNWFMPLKKTKLEAPPSNSSEDTEKF